MKTALIGYGSMGKNHYRNCQLIDGIELVAVCDTNPEDKIDVPLYDNLKIMLQKEDIDAVIISVPTIHHKDVALKCISHGKHILIEKPLASTIDEAQEIINAAEKYKVKAVVGHIERFNPVVSSLKKELEDKDILSIHITRVGPFPPRISDVGILIDLSVHDIDLIRMLTNRSEILQSSIYESMKVGKKHTDNAILSFKLENDIVAGITTNWLTPFKKRTIEVATSNAYLEANLMSQELTEYSAYQINNSFIIRNCYVKKGEPLMKELEAFRDYITSDIKSQLATLEDGKYTLEVLQRK